MFKLLSTKHLLMATLTRTIKNPKNLNKIIKNSILTSKKQ